MAGDSEHACGRPFASVLAAAASPASSTELDLRGLAAPEPMQRALAAVHALSSGATLTVLMPMLPTPLLQLLASRGLDARAQCLPDGSARVTIRHVSGDEHSAHPHGDGQARA